MSSVARYSTSQRYRVGARTSPTTTVAAGPGGGETEGVTVSGHASRARWRAALLAFVVAAGCPSACGSSSTTVSGTRTSGSGSASSTLPPELVAKLEEVVATTALGDSVPYGTACECTPFPQLVGADVAQVASHSVETS